MKIFPTFGFADQDKFKTQLNLEGQYFWGIEKAQFGNFSYDLDLRNLYDSYAELTIPKYINTTRLDNFTVYGDNRAIVEMRNSIVGTSISEQTFTYINHYNITYAEPTLVNKEGDIMYLTGEGFINTPALNCKFGDLLATSVKYYNRTNIHCGTPFITDLTLQYTISVTFNGIEYLYFVDPLTKKNVTLDFTAPIVVNYLDP